MMLEHAKKNPLNDLFKFAVFLGASLPFNLDDTTGLTQWETAKKNARYGVTNSLFAGELDSSTPPLVRQQSTESDSSSKEEEETHTRGFPLKPWEGVVPGALLARYTTDLSLRIHAPTLHIFGTEDPYFGQSAMLVKLCAGETMVVQHGQGHRVPRDRAFEKQSMAAMDFILKMVVMAN